MYNFESAIKDFIFHCKHEKGLSEKTLKFYSIDLRQFKSFLVQKSIDERIRNIDKSVLREYIESISEAKPKTINRKIATLKALFNYFEFDGKLDINPFRLIRLKVKEAKTLPEVLDVNEVCLIFQHARLISNERKTISKYGEFEYLRNLAVLELLFATGARVSELSNLRSCNVDLKGGVIKVQGKGNKERVIQICNSETLMLLNRYKDLVNYLGLDTLNYFFLNRIKQKYSEQSVRLLIKKFSKHATITKRVTPHVFRHTVATLLLDEGVDITYIQRLLGHSNISTTQIYTHISNRKQKEMLERFHPRKMFNLDYN